MTQDHIDRLNGAIKALDILLTETKEQYAQAGVDSGPEEHRLRGKIEGVQLALSYALEALKIDA